MSPRKTIQTRTEMGRCTECGTKAVAIKMTLVPCGCTTNVCARCASVAFHSVSGPLVHKAIDGAHVLVHSCGHKAPLTVWRITREPLL